MFPKTCFIPSWLYCKHFLSKGFRLCFVTHGWKVATITSPPLSIHHCNWVSVNHNAIVTKCLHLARQFLLLFDYGQCAYDARCTEPYTDQVCWVLPFLFYSHFSEEFLWGSKLNKLNFVRSITVQKITQVPVGKSYWSTFSKWLVLTRNATQFRTPEISLSWKRMLKTQQILFLISFIQMFFLTKMWLEKTIKSTVWLCHVFDGELFTVVILHWFCFQIEIHWIILCVGLCCKRLCIGLARILKMLGRSLCKTHVRQLYRGRDTQTTTSQHAGKFMYFKIGASHKWEIGLTLIT